MGNKASYKKILMNATKELGTYDKSFDASLNILAEIMTERENVYKEYVKGGRHPLVLTISDRGAENYRQNPLLKQWNDLNSSALSYLSAVGLTPAGLKKITNDAIEKNEPDALSRLLYDIEAIT